jgi:hypothetical protein
MQSGVEQARKFTPIAKVTQRYVLISNVTVSDDIVGHILEVALLLAVLTEIYYS